MKNTAKKSPLIQDLRKLRVHPEFIIQSWWEEPEKGVRYVRSYPAPGSKIKDRSGTEYLRRDDGSLYRRSTKPVAKSGRKAVRREVARSYFFEAFKNSQA